MSSDLQFLKRLRVAAACGRLPPDVGHWVVRLAESTIARRERRALRDSYLRAAADQIHGSLHRKCVALAELVARYRSVSAAVGNPDPGSCEYWVRMALLVDARAPVSIKQLSRIIGHRALYMSNDSP
jgi:hypothetical protein